MSTTIITDEKNMLPVGTMLQRGKYRIERYISSGGFGNTYLATNTTFNEPVAIKEFFMRDVALRDSETTAVSVVNTTNLPVFQEQLEKFRKEALRLRNLRSEHIVAVSDLFDENDTAYYVMDFIDGESLRDMVKKGPLPEKDVRDYLEQTLEAMEVVHQQNFYHLDLKPANLMVDKTGRLRVIDFGASKQHKDGEIYSKSAICYSPGYAPPEQQEQAMNKFGPYTDFYALGATLYNVLTGETPPKTTDIADDGEEAFHFPATVSKQMRDLIIWMMQSNRKARPQSVADIRNYLKGGKPEEKPEIKKPKPEKPKPGEGGSGIPSGSGTTSDEKTILTPPGSHGGSGKGHYPGGGTVGQGTSGSGKGITSGGNRPVVDIPDDDEGGGNSKLKYIILSCCIAAAVVVGGYFLLNSNQSNNEPYDTEAVADGDYKVSVVVVVMKSADKIDYYALADKGHDKYEIVKSVKNYSPADKQVNVAVSSDRRTNQQNNVDAMMEEIFSTYSSAKAIFLAQKNLQSDPAVKSIDDKLTRFDLGITYYDPSQYAGEDSRMVEEFVNQHVSM